MNHQSKPHDYQSSTVRWNRAAAKELAGVHGIGPLNSDHWKVIDFVRKYFDEHGIGPSAYCMHKGTGLRLQRLCELFPGAITWNAHVLAGLPNPCKVNLGLKIYPEFHPETKAKEESTLENCLLEDLESLPFGGLPFSYEGTFSALFQEEGEKNSTRKWESSGNGIDHISDDSIRGLFPLPFIARYKFVPFAAVLVVAILSSFALIKNTFNGHPIGMTIYHALVRNGFVEVPLKFVQEKKLVSFEYQQPGATVPLIAYVTPSGKVGTAVGLSFPCHSDKFHLEGKEIVCDVCLTRWDLETLQANSGECLDHPLDRLSNIVQGGKVMIPEEEIQSAKKI